METIENHPPDAQIKRPFWLRLLFPFAATALSLFLLSTWVTNVAKAGELKDISAPNVSFDYEVRKQSNPPGKFTFGTNNTYIINVSGVIFTTGSSPSILDNLPTGMTIVDNSISATNWVCNVLNNKTTIQCSYAGSLTPDSLGNISFPPIIFNVNVQTNIVTPAINTVYLTADGDINPANNKDSDVVHIDSVDLELLKKVIPDQVLNVGDSITYYITVTNYGPANAVNVVVTDTLSSLLSYIKFEPSAGSVPPPTPSMLTWSIPNLNMDASAYLTITAQVASGSFGKQIPNTARVTSANLSDYKPSNNIATASVVVGGPKINKEIVSRGNLYYVGQPIKYKITVSNQTSITITNVLVKDHFANGLTIISPSGIGNTRNWLFSRISPGVTKEITAIVRGNPNVIKPVQGLMKIYEIENTASVYWNLLPISITSEPVKLKIQPAVDLQIGLTDNRTTVYPGQAVTYTVGLTNTGSISATKIQISDLFPTNLTFLSVITDTNVNVKNISTSPYVWEVTKPVNLTPAQKISFLIKARVDKNVSTGDLIINTVKVSSKDLNSDSTTDFYTENNEATDTDTVQALPEVTIVLNVSPPEAKIGEILSFKTEVRNKGNTAISNVRVTNIFPSVLDYVSTTSTSLGTATVNASTRTLTWTIPTLAAGKTATNITTWKINTNAVVNKIYSDEASLRYDPAGYIESNTVRFRVLPAGVLPGTGIFLTHAGTRLHSVLGQSDLPSLSTPYLVAICGSLLGVLGLLLLAYTLRVRKTHPLYVGRYMRLGLGLLLVGAVTLCGSLIYLTSQGRPAALSQATQVSQTQIPLATKRHSATKLPPFPTSESQPRPLPTDFVDHFTTPPTPTPSALPNYPIPTPTVLITPDANGLLPDTSPIVRIVIPALGLDTVVKYVPFDGTTWMIGGLKQEVAWMGETSWPGLGGNTGLAGHVDLTDGSDGPFARLRELKPGDEVVLYTEKNIYTYRVREQVIVEDYDLSVIQQTENPQITLITCINWDAELRTYLKRLIVFSDLISVKPIQ